MSLTTDSIEQGTTAESLLKQKPNSVLGATKALLSFTGVATLAAAALPVFFSTLVLLVTTLPAVFTTAVFVGVASTGDLGSSISQVLLG